jgi:hypothetical protein
MAKNGGFLKTAAGVAAGAVVGAIGVRVWDRHIAPYLAPGLGSSPTKKQVEAAREARSNPEHALESAERGYDDYVPAQYQAALTPVIPVMTVGALQPPPPPRPRLPRVKLEEGNPVVEEDDGESEFDDILARYDNLDDDF